jgi:hypothetical protein
VTNKLLIYILEIKYGDHWVHLPFSMIMAKMTIVMEDAITNDIWSCTKDMISDIDNGALWTT